MASGRRTQRTRSLLVALVLVAITLVSIDSRSHGGGVLGRVQGDLHDGLSPLQRATHSALGPVGDFFAGAASYRSLQADNARLRTQLAAESAAQVADGAAAAEARAVIAGAHLPFAGAQHLVEAQVIEPGSSNFDEVVTIDKGSDDGLVVGQPVVAAGVTDVPGSTGGLVGSIEAVAAHTASIELLTDPDQVVGVDLPSSNVGDATGIGAGRPLQVAVVSVTAPVPTLAKGQTVSTSGLPLERYPAGIPVGRITSVTTPAGSSEPTCEVSPLVDLATLGVVEVMLWSPQSP